jgi:hypothetical protein
MHLTGKNLSDTNRRRADRRDRSREKLTRYLIRYQMDLIAAVFAILTVLCGAGVIRLAVYLAERVQ